MKKNESLDMGSGSSDLFLIFNVSDFDESKVSLLSLLFLPSILVFLLLQQINNPNKRIGMIVFVVMFLQLLTTVRKLALVLRTSWG